MTLFTISRHDASGDTLFNVRQPDYLTAAQRATTKIYGTARGIFCQRETGNLNCSGIYVAYKYDPATHASNRLGQFHISEN